jgi:hypothetical protein
VVEVEGLADALQEVHSWKSTKMKINAGEIESFYKDTISRRIVLSYKEPCKESEKPINSVTNYDSWFLPDPVIKVKEKKGLLSKLFQKGAATEDKKEEGPFYKEKHEEIFSLKKEVFHIELISGTTYHITAVPKELEFSQTNSENASGL